MDEQTSMLLLLAIVMLVGSYLAGNIPLVVNLSEEKLRSVTIFGAGLLVGTALTVIIPEGISALSMDNEMSTTKDNKIYTSGVTTKKENANIHHAHTNDYSSTIGLSLVLGFIFMLLVDQISQRRSSSDKNITATLGLVVHAAADGVALGAAATTSHQDVEMIVFLAIMLHKAPAAFGLVSFLLHEGIDRQRIRKHLAIFSLSAPLFALITYFGIGQEQKETLDSVNATGIAMLFSAGTFLYVATVHVLPELTQNTGHSHSHNSSGRSNINYDPLDKGEDGNGISIINANPKGYGGLKNFELIVMVCGALLPLIITFGHHH
ncbi:zinc transporter ZIP9 [Condylostylus longicornis]|uniref:zinc transporter ZIP9 n=1 Tax=Condylostylus longicornis TaxID=2530218 RepID=UPI00244E0FA1|nr:zinc transporter ZIP9 [Condylostylus longicornis]